MGTTSQCSSTVSPVVRGPIATELPSKGAAGVGEPRRSRTALVLSSPCTKLEPTGLPRGAQLVLQQRHRGGADALPPGACRRSTAVRGTAAPPGPRARPEDHADGLVVRVDAANERARVIVRFSERDRVGSNGTVPAPAWIPVGTSSTMLSSATSSSVISITPRAYSAPRSCQCRAKAVDASSSRRAIPPGSPAAE